MTDTTILLNILSSIQRLETHIESQHGRLNNLELCMSSSEAASSIGGSSTSAPDSPVTDHDGSERDSSVASPRTPPGETPAALYEASILKLRNRFEFTDDSSSDLHWPRVNTTVKDTLKSQDRLQIPLDGTELRGNGVNGSMPRTVWTQHGEEWVDDDIYSLSVYSSRPLSRFDLGVDSVPPLPQNLPHAVPDQQSEKAHSRSATPAAVYRVRESATDGEPGNGAGFPLEPVAIIPQSQQSRPSRRVASSRASSPRSSTLSRQGSNRNPLVRAETALYSAYGTLKSSLQTRMSFRSKMGRVNRVETERKAGAIPAEVRVENNGVTSSDPVQRGWAITVRGAVARIFTRTTYYRSRPYITA